MGENDFVPIGSDFVCNSIWKECNDDLKDSLGSIFVPTDSLYVDLCKNHAISSKMLADTIDLPC